MEAQFLNIISDGYVNVESLLSDNQALKLQASDPNGGIIMNAGFGGITVNSGNTIALNADAASHFTTTMGNLTLESTIGLVNIDGAAGINIGNDAITDIIDIGSSAIARDLIVGNNTGATSVIIRSGTGKINLNSAATGTDAILVFSSGGVDVDAAVPIYISPPDQLPKAIDHL
jgi:hypothetical protein